MYVDLGRALSARSCPLWDLALSVLQDPHIRKTVVQIQSLPPALLKQVFLRISAHVRCTSPLRLPLYRSCII